MSSSVYPRRTPSLSLTAKIAFSRYARSPRLTDRLKPRTHGTLNSRRRRRSRSSTTNRSGFRTDMARRLNRAVRDNPAWHLVLEPDPDTGELWPVIRFGQPTYIYISREERELQFWAAMGKYSETMMDHVLSPRNGGVHGASPT